MATQGIISICKEDEVVMKLVAGSDGYNAAKLAVLLGRQRPLDAHKAYALALEENFGDVHSLVVLTALEVVFDGDDDLHPRYQETFSDALFNPRWESGLASHVEIVEV